MITYLIVKLIKKTSLLVIFMSYFLESQRRSKNETKAELNLFKYSTKPDLKTQQVLIFKNLLKRLI